MPRKETPLTLAKLLAQTGDYQQPYPSGAIQVFSTDRRYWALSDFVVSSAVSGPSIVLVPRKPNPPIPTPADFSLGHPDE